MVDARGVVEELYEEVVNRRRPEVAEQLVADSFMDHTAPPGAERAGAQAFQEQVDAIIQAVPDASVIVDDLVAEGDRVAARLTWRGTLKGSLHGIPPSHQPVVLSEMVFWRVSGGKLVERWAMVDEWGLRRQIDAQFRSSQGPSPAVW